MNTFVRGWCMGIAGGIFLMLVLSKIPALSSGATLSDWITVIAGTIVVIASVAAVIQATRQEKSAS